MARRDHAIDFVSSARGVSRGHAAVALLIVAMSLAAPLARAGAQQQRPVGRILGVFDDATGQPIAGAEVLDMATGTKALTSETGTISLAWLDKGATVLQIRKLGYASHLTTVMVSQTDTVSVTVILRQLAQALPEVRTKAPNTTTGKLAGFEQRRARGLGHFITQDQLDKFSNMLTSSIMTQLPGLYMVGTPSHRFVANTRSPTGKGRPCLAQVIVDGVIVYGGPPQSPFSVDEFRPEEIAGVEYYAGAATMPVEYSNTTRTTCGLVIIWTR